MALVPPSQMISVSLAGVPPAVISPLMLITAAGEPEALPVTEIGQVLSLQAGNVGGHVRGGRAGEVAYWIDGVPVTDAYDGGQVVEVNKSLVQELQLVSGAFNAEYGQAMSAIVNIATREGGPKFAGGAGTYFGDYASNHTSVFPGINKVNPFNIRDFEGNLSGPIVGGPCLCNLQLH